MLRLKLSEECNQVYVRMGLENQLTGKKNTVDAKIDTGAVITLIPMHLVSNMEFEVVGETDLAMANSDKIHAYIVMAVVSLSDEDAFELPVYICKSKNDLALIGMDILRQCNYAQWHEWKEGEHSMHFEIELAEAPE